MSESKHPTTQPTPGQVGACVRCSAEREVRHMVRLESGRLLCQRCVAVLRGGMNDSPVPPQKVDATSATEASAEIVPDTVPCPKCHTPVLFGMPTCEQCGIILSDFWEEEEVRHPVTQEQRHRRLLVRAAVIVGVLAVGVLFWPEEEVERRWEGILNTMFAGGGESLEEHAKGTIIHPSIQRMGRNIVLQNDDPFEWTDITVTLNGGMGGRAGFVLSIPQLLSNTSRKHLLKRFEKSDGTSFTPVGVPITRVDIRAMTPDGLAIWALPEFVDVTEATTVD